MDARAVRQEREVTGALLAVIRHQNIDDVVLNTAQMRSYRHLQHFHIEAAPLDRERCIHEGAAQETATQRNEGHQAARDASRVTAGIRNRVVNPLRTAFASSLGSGN